MEEMIIGLGADNSKLLKILNNTQTSIDKFLGSKGIKDLQKLDIKFDESSFKNALKNYEKNVTKTLSKIKKGFSITIGDGDEITEIPIIPRKGIKNVHELNNALKNLKKYRESALEGTKDIDNLIKNKPRILIMTKLDLCDQEETKKWISHYESLGYKVVALDLINNPNLQTIYNETNKKNSVKYR